MDSHLGFNQKGRSTHSYKIKISKPGTVGFGKRYPDFWLNYRPEKNIETMDSGMHVCLRADSKDIVDNFYKKAMTLGIESYGAPGFRPEYHNGYYAAFIRDVDLNHLEVVTFEQQES